MQIFPLTLHFVIGTTSTFGHHRKLGFGLMGKNIMLGNIWPLMEVFNLGDNLTNGNVPKFMKGRLKILRKRIKFQLKAL